MNFERCLEQSSAYKNFRFVFVSDAQGSVTQLMKCIIPARALNCYQIDAFVISKEQFEEYASKNSSDSDVVILSKVHSWLSEDFVDLLFSHKERFHRIYCEASEEGSFDTFLSKFDLHFDNLKNFVKVIDGFLYETEELKDLISSKFENLNFLFTRHLHSNCISTINPYSGIVGDEKSALVGIDKELTNKAFEYLSGQARKTFSPHEFVLGYIGHPKYCHDYLALNIATYEISHKLGFLTSFYSSNPGPQLNVRETLKINFGFSLIEENDHSSVYFKYKTGNKVTALWSLGIPGLFSPLPSYKKIFEENMIDFDYWSIPQEFEKFDCEVRNSQSLGREISNKIKKILLDKDFPDRINNLHEVSRRYNPMNVFWLYESMFKDVLKTKK